MSRPERWWRPATNRRPGLRARQRAMYTEQEMGQAFDIAYQAGQGDERKNSSERDDMLRRLAAACEEGPDSVTALARECGVMPIGDVTPDISDSQLVDEVERWLREQD